MLDGLLLKINVKFTPQKTKQKQKMTTKFCKIYKLSVEKKNIIRTQNKLEVVTEVYVPFSQASASQEHPEQTRPIPQWYI